MFTARPASGPLGTKPAANLGTGWFRQAGPSFCSAGTNEDCSLLEATTFGGALFNSYARQRDTEQRGGCLVFSAEKACRPHLRIFKNEKINMNAHGVFH